MNKMWIAGVAGALAVCGAGVLAQGRPGGMMGGPGGPPGGGMGGRARMRMPMTLNRAPIDALKGPLKLNDAQVKKLETMQGKFREQAMQAFRPGGGMGGPGGGRPGMGAPGGGRPSMGGPGGGRPGMGAPGGMDPAAMQKSMEKLQAMAKKSSAEMTAVLTPAQRSKVPALLAAMDAAQASGIPAGAVGVLNLTPDQVKKLSAVGASSREKMGKAFQGMGPGGDRNAMMQKFGALRDEQRKAALAVLTPAQRTAVTKYEKEHPRRGFGGPGGPGMGGPGGPGGPGMGGPGGPGMGGPGGPGGGRRR